MDERVADGFEIYLSALFCTPRYQEDPQLSSLKAPVFAAVLELPQAGETWAEGARLLDAVTGRTPLTLAA